MGRLFKSTSTQYIASVTGLSIPDAPCSIAGWVYIDDAATQYRIMTLHDSVGGGSISLQARGDVGGDPIRCEYDDSSAVTTVDTGTSFSTATWHHIACKVTSRDVIYVALDGVITVDSDGSPATGDASPDTIYFGSDDSQSILFNGRLAEWGLWNDDLDTREIESLAKSIIPKGIRPGNLISYWPLLGKLSPEIDLISKFNLTLNGAPPITRHPRIYHIPQPQQTFKGAEHPLSTVYKKRLIIT